MTPAKELRSLRAKLKRRDAKIYFLQKTACAWQRRAEFMEDAWVRTRKEEAELSRELQEEMSQVGRLQGEIAAIHTINALRAAQAKILAEKDTSSC